MDSKEKPVAKVKKKRVKVAPETTTTTTASTDESFKGIFCILYDFMRFFC